MKESRLLQMEKNIDTLGKVAQELTMRLEQLKIVVMGDHEVVKQLEEFPAIIEKMQEAQKGGEDGAI